MKRAFKGVKRALRWLRALLGRFWPIWLSLVALGLIWWGAWGRWRPAPLIVGFLLWLDLTLTGRRKPTDGNT